MNYDWNNTFLDEEARSYATSEDESDDPDGEPIMPDSESEESGDERVHTTPVDSGSRGGTTDQTLLRKVLYVIDTMEGIGLDLVAFLEAMSWGDASCSANARIRHHRATLLKSSRLSIILRRWWRPPRPSRSHNRRPAGAACILEKFAMDCFSHVVERELEGLTPLFRSPRGADTTEEQLTGVVFKKTIEDVKTLAPQLWHALYSLACSKRQQLKNTHKRPEKVSLSCSLIRLLHCLQLYNRSYS